MINVKFYLPAAAFEAVEKGGVEIAQALTNSEFDTDTYFTANQLLLRHYIDCLHRIDHNAKMAAKDYAYAVEDLIFEDLGLMPERREFYEFTKTHRVEAGETHTVLSIKQPPDDVLILITFLIRGSMLPYSAIDNPVTRYVTALGIFKAHALILDKIVDGTGFNLSEFIQAHIDRLEVIMQNVEGFEQLARLMRYTEN